MKYEKFYNSRFFSFFEFLYKLVLLNAVTVTFCVLGLFMFSFMPALIALIIIIRSVKNGNAFPLLGTYVRCFFKNYIKSFKLSVFYIMLGFVFAFNTYFFYDALLEHQGFINAVLYYTSLFVDLILILAVINACFVYVYFPNLNNRKIIKYSFILLRAIPTQALLITALIGAGFALLYVNILNIIFVSIFMALFVFVCNALIETHYAPLIADGVCPLDAFMYVNGSRG